VIRLFGMPAHGIFTGPKVNGSLPSFFRKKKFTSSFGAPKVTRFLKVRNCFQNLQHGNLFYTRLFARGSFANA
jgi:hypothetical protein